MPFRTPSQFLLPMALLALLAAPGAAAEANRPCIDPGKVRGWTALPQRQVLIDAGRRHYLVELAEQCPQLHDSPFLGYRSNHPAGRVCGRSGDSLVPHGSATSELTRCPISALRELASEEYGRLLQDSRNAVALDTKS